MSRMITETRIPTDRFTENVAILYDLISILPEAQGDDFKVVIPDVAEELEGSHKSFREILKILHHGGHVRFKPPRETGEGED